MTSPVVPLSYASPDAGMCPLCTQRPVSNKKIYGRPVCKKCLYKFANRRQLAYLVDTLLFAVPVLLLMFFVVLPLIEPNMTGLQAAIANTLIGLALNVLFNMKDGFNGQSPGKMLTGVQVIDETTGKPIGFAQSFKRNAIFLLGLIPFVGGFVSLAIVIVILIQMNKGPRLGDRFAKTRVVWKKYADSSVFGGNDTLCRKCHYDLTGNVSGQCPECGTAVHAA